MFEEDSNGCATNANVLIVADDIYDHSLPVRHDKTPIVLKTEQLAAPSTHRWDEVRKTISGLEKPVQLRNTKKRPT
jgi:hypothetical protein